MKNQLVLDLAWMLLRIPTVTNCFPPPNIRLPKSHRYAEETDKEANIAADIGDEAVTSAPVTVGQDNEAGDDAGAFCCAQPVHNDHYA